MFFVRGKVCKVASIIIFSGLCNHCMKIIKNTFCPFFQLSTKYSREKKKEKCGQII